MANWLTNLLTGGAAGRADSISGSDTRFTDLFGSAYQSAPKWVQDGTRIKSAFRNNELQAKLWADALKKYGSPEAARKWVAPPGSSQHNKGRAFDLEYSSSAVKDWWHKNAGANGLVFPMSNENWHIEAAGGRQWSTSGGASSAPTSFSNTTVTNGQIIGGYNLPAAGKPLQIGVNANPVTAAGVTLPNGAVIQSTGSASQDFLNRILGTSPLKGADDNHYMDGSSVAPGTGGIAGDIAGGIGGGLTDFGGWMMDAISGPLYRILFVLVGLILLVAGLWIITRQSAGDIAEAVASAAKS